MTDLVQEEILQCQMGDATSDLVYFHNKTCNSSQNTSDTRWRYVETECEYFDAVRKCRTTNIVVQQAKTSNMRLCDAFINVLFILGLSYKHQPGFGEKL